MSQKPMIIQEVLKVKAKTFLTPHFIRVTLTGENIFKFANATVGANNKIFIPPSGLNEVHFPELDLEKRQWIYPPDTIRPFVRTYSHSGFNATKNEMYIDFVSHGENGPASAWALYCNPGDVLGVAMKTDKKELYPKANWYLLAGDATAIPVLSCILESLPATANGKCIIEVHSKEDEQLLKTKANIDFYWLHNPKPEQSSTLAKEVKKVSFPDFPNVSRYSYVAAEFNTVKEIRNYLRKEMNWKREELNAYSYWKAGVSEDNSAQERHNENEEAYQKRHTVINTTHKI